MRFARRVGVWIVVGIRNGAEEGEVGGAEHCRVKIGEAELRIPHHASTWPGDARQTQSTGATNLVVVQDDDAVGITEPECALRVPIAEQTGLEEGRRFR